MLVVESDKELESEEGRLEPVAVVVAALCAVVVAEALRVVVASDAVSVLDLDEVEQSVVCVEVEVHHQRACKTRSSASSWAPSSTSLPTCQVLEFIRVEARARVYAVLRQA